MITLKSKEDISILREGGNRLASILEEVVAAATAGVSTLELDNLAESLILKSGGRPAFKGYRVAETKIPYPATLCTSVNNEVVHAIPSKKRILRRGDIIGLDIGMQWPRHHGLFTDMAVSIGIGKISPEAGRLIESTKQALQIGIEEVCSGKKTGDIGCAIQNFLESCNFGVIRDLAGHGVGYKLHEEPLVPNYGKRGTGIELKEGMVIAVEPMATLGSFEITLDDDEWTFKTADGSLAAHFEHTLVVTKDGAEVLTKK